MKKKMDALQRVEALQRGLKRGFKAAAAAMRSQKYSAADKPVRCLHCGNETFEQATALLNTAGLSFLNLDWANRSATTLVCTECGHVQWFLKAPEKRVG